MQGVLLKEKTIHSHNKWHETVTGERKNLGKTRIDIQDCVIVNYT